MSDDVVIAIVMAIPGAIIATATLITSLQHRKQLMELHFQINSRMDQLLATSKGEAHAAGVAQGIAEAKEERK